MKVIIIGGGLGGLAFANGLVRNGIEVNVYERSDEGEPRGQGYRIGINEEGEEALYKVGMKETIAEEAILDEKALSGVKVIEEKGLKELLHVPLAKGGLACRWLLHKALSQRLLSQSKGASKAIISHSKRFTHYEILSDRIVAHFEDG